MSLSSTSLPKPKNWQDFENKTRELFACVLGDPKTQQNGRSGQKQSGVDVYGYRSDNYLVGIQCKKKFDNNVNEKELRSEVNKAKLFRPKISEFILITTAPRDQKIQECARLITEELSKTDHPFYVSVWGWDDIEEQASKHDKAWKAFDPTWNPFIERGFEKIAVELDGVKRSLDSIKNGTLPSSTKPSDQDLNESDENTPLHGQVTVLQRLIDDGYVRAALTQLMKLKSDEWANASRSERYRILVGIASVKIKLGEQADAGGLLLDAFNECPEHKNARRNRAAGLLLQDKTGEAAKLAREILAEDSNNADAAGTLIQALINDTNCIDPLSDVPEALRETKEVLIAYAHFLRCRNNPDWVDIAKTSAIKYPDCKLLKQFAAEAVLDDLARTDRDAMAGGLLQHVTAREVNEAVETLYSEARDALDKGYALVPSLAHNAALALRFADDLGRAKEILDAAIEQYPADENLRLQRALIALSENDPAGALAISPKKPADPEAIGILAEALSATGRQDDALSLIHDTDEITLPDHVRTGLLGVRTRAYIAQGEKQVATDVVNNRVAREPKNLSLRILQIQTYRAVGEDDAALRAFEEALASIDEHTSLPSRLALCFEALKFGRNDAIVDLLKGRVATDRASEGLHVLIATSINSGFWATAREILDSVSADLRRTEWFQRADAIFSINTGDAMADEKVARYLRSSPNDVQMILAQIGIWQRKGREADIRQLLKHLNLVGLEGHPEQRIQVAAMIIHYGEAFRGLEYGYSVLMDNWNRPKAHLAYQSLIFMNEDIGGAMPSAEVVAENTIVCILAEGSERKYRIERTQHAFFEDERLDPQSDLAGLLIGKSQGAKFSLQERLGSKPVEVLWIKPVYLDAFHCSLEQFNERFPRADGLLKFTIDANAPDPFEEIRAITKDRAETDQRMLREYRSKNLPLSFVAALIGKDPLDAWSGLPTINEGFQVCRGTYEERKEALQILKTLSNKGCVVDAITLSVIRRLGVERAVVEICGPIHTPQSVVDLLASRAMEAKHNIGKQQGFIGWRDGQLFFEEYSEETLQKIAEDRASELKWARAVASVASAIPKTDLSQDARAIVNMVGHVASDPAVVADGQDLLLLSEDMGFRIWASATFKVPTVWLQPVLICARDEGVLKPDQYCEAVNMLALSGHTFTSLDVNCLMHQTLKDDFVLTRELSRLIGTIGGPSADLRSNSAIMSAFIDILIEECTDNLKAMRIISDSFNSITNKRWEDQRQLVFLILKQLRSKKKKAVVKHALGWLIGHSFGMPYFNELLCKYKDTNP